MALTKVTGQVIKNTTDVTVGVLTVTNTLSVGGTVSIGGTLTYEDVTNVDAVGLITARNGIVVGSGITLSKDGDVFFTGIATGNGSGLTALNASNLGSGTVPTARLGSGTASSSTFLRGDSTFAAVTSTTINNNANNRVITGSGTANTLEGEANLQFDGTNIGVGVAPSGVASYSTIHLKGQTSGNGGAVRLTDYGDTPDSDDFTIYKNSAAGYLRINGTDPLIAYLNGADRVRIDSSGRVMIGTDTEGSTLADDFTVNTSSGNGGITISTDTSSVGSLLFSDATSGTAEYAGFIQYDHSQNHLILGSSSAETMHLDQDGNVGIGENDPVDRLVVQKTNASGDVGIRIKNDTTTDGSAASPTTASLYLNTSTGTFNTFYIQARRYDNETWMGYGDMTSAGHIPTLCLTNDKRVGINTHVPKCSTQNSSP